MIISASFEEDLRESYLDYALSVIIGRAIPDVRDGLKPVQRRILYAMRELGLFHNKPYKKSARIVGETLGKYHPHGDAAIYDALVRMAQDFNMRYPLIDGQGNFGSIDNDPPAAMRYTEARLRKIAEEMLEELDKEVVEFVPNFDNTTKEPVVLPSKIPNLLINGATGIAVGMATNIPPHNLNEICDALIAIIEGKGEDEILEIVKGPDFPLGGIVVNENNILKTIYKKGKGSVRVRGEMIVDEKGNIVIKSIPYQVSKAEIIEKIVKGVENKKIFGIYDVVDMSDKEGIHVVVKLKKGANPEKVMALIYKYTPMEVNYNVMNVAIVESQPKLLSLFEMLRLFVEFRKEIVRKRCEFELRKKRERLHVVEGLLVAIQNIDEIIELMKKANNAGEAKLLLMERFSLTPKQSEAIINMRLSSLTGMERERLEKEKETLTEEIKKILYILSSEKNILQVVKEEIEEIKKKYGDERRTKIVEKVKEIKEEELIEEKACVIILTEEGYIKKFEKKYWTNARVKKANFNLKKGDKIIAIKEANNTSTILLFGATGKAYSIKAYDLDFIERNELGEHISHFRIKDRITAMLPIDKFEGCIVAITKNGKGLKVNLKELENAKRAGIAFMKLKRNDEIVEVMKDPKEILLFTKNGMSLRFNSEEIREMGRGSQGVIVMNVKDDAIISASEAKDGYAITITENGFAKRTKIDEYRTQGRGGMGIINISISEKTGDVVFATVGKHGRIYVFTEAGKMYAFEIFEIKEQGRNTQGARIVEERVIGGGLIF